MAMRVPSVRATGLVALALAAASAVDVAAAPAARYALHAPRLEALPPSLQQGRFLMRVRIEPAPPPPVQADAGALRLTATIAPKALVAQCPLPGSIFLDGFDRP
jgi:hypothetical protein